MSPNRRNEKKRFNAGLLAAVLILILVVAAGLYLVSRYQKMQDAKIAASYEKISTPTPAPVETPVQPTPEPTISPEEIKAQEEAARAREEALKAEAAQYNFYEKLEKGYGAEVLILGDASAADAEADDAEGIVDGAKFSSLSRKLEEKYLASSGRAVRITNLANISGNILYDVMRVNNMPDDPAYDLVILSYGINDQKTDVLSNFEALILALRNKFPKCSVICTIEPCFHSVTNDLQTMINESSAYGIPVINLFSEFYNKGADKYFDYFIENQTLPNDKGTEEWIRLICEKVDENIDNSIGDTIVMPTIVKRSVDLSKLKFIPVTDARAVRKDDTSFTFDINAKGLSYIQHEQMLDGKDIKIVADDILYTLNKPAMADTPSGGYIIFLHDELVCKNDLTVTFANKELADGFEGLYITEN